MTNSRANVLYKLAWQVRPHTNACANANAATFACYYRQMMSSYYLIAKDYAPPKFQPKRWRRVWGTVDSTLSHIMVGLHVNANYSLLSAPARSTMSTNGGVNFATNLFPFGGRKWNFSSLARDWKFVNRVLLLQICLVPPQSRQIRVYIHFFLLWLCFCWH